MWRQMPAPFVPAEFVVPTLLETPEFRLRPLTINDVIKDYDAVMSSIDPLTTGWAHIIDQVENRVVARYLGSPAEILGETTGTHFHTV